MQAGDIIIASVYYGQTRDEFGNDSKVRPFLVLYKRGGCVYGFQITSKPGNTVMMRRLRHRLKRYIGRAKDITSYVDFGHILYVRSAFLKTGRIDYLTADDINGLKRDIDHQRGYIIAYDVDRVLETLENAK